MSRTALQPTLANLHHHRLWSLCQCALGSATEKEKWFLKGKMQHALHPRTNAMLLRAVSQAALLLHEKKHWIVTHSQTTPTSRTPEGSQQFLYYWFYIRRVSQTHYECLERKVVKQQNIIWRTLRELIKIGTRKGFLCAFNCSWRTPVFCFLAILVWSDHFSTWPLSCLIPEN